MGKTMKYFALYAALLAFVTVLASCQEEIEIIDTPDASQVHVFHVELAATVAGGTKASYASKEITFEEGDALYVALTQPASAAWSEATGTLTYDGTSFKGDVAYTGTYDGSDIIKDARDLSATFLPKDYAAVNYLSDAGVTTASNAFYAGAKDAAVPQLVHLTAMVSDKAGESKSPLTLSANNAVLFYTIAADALSAGSHSVSVSNGNGTTITGTVSAAAGTATTFAVAFAADATERAYTLSIPGYSDVAKSGKTLSAGKVVNISTTVRKTNAPLSGVFSVCPTETVRFSGGNLQATYDGSAWSWAFAANQFDYIGNAASNNCVANDGKVSTNGTVDLFYWSTANNHLGLYPIDGCQGAFVDWGEAADVEAGIGDGWRTLSSEEWAYLLDGRSITNRYCMATVNDKCGLVIFPDSYSHPAGVTAVSSANTSTASFSSNTWSATDWDKVETAGAVFLPAAGYRVSSTNVFNEGSVGIYWSSTPYSDTQAYDLIYWDTSFNYTHEDTKSMGASVRLVQHNSFVPLPGGFSVSDEKTVKFSAGNLQATYDGIAWSWSFAKHQYDYIGEAAANTSISGNGTVSTNGTVDLFGWSTSKNYLGIHKSGTSTDYDGDFKDWGANASVQAGIGTGWRTLSSDEWTYLLNTRSATNRYCKANVNGKAGLVIFPDSYSHPTDVTAVSSANTGNAAFTTNTWSADDWIKIEAAGAVFLPAAGRRVTYIDNKVYVYYPGQAGNYWSSTSVPDSNNMYAFELYFIDSSVEPTWSGMQRWFGMSVRLVQNQ